MKPNRISIVTFTLLIVVAMLAACAPAATQAPTAAPAATMAPAAPAATAAPAPTTAPAASSGKIKIGISFSDFATERWPIENQIMTVQLQKDGFEVISQEADHDVKLQSDQIDNMVAEGVKGLIVIAEDGDAAVTPVEAAVAAGVKVVSYDRLIKTDKISAYLSFDNVAVGKAEADGVVKALGLLDANGQPTTQTKWTKDNPVKLVLSGGSPTDNNAVLLKQGQMEILKPFVDQGIVKIVFDQGVDNWDPAKAESMMENILTAQQNKIDAVVASNDGTADGEIIALRAQHLAGTVPISGQDATAAGCNEIVLGEQTVTVFKDTRLLSPQAVKMIEALVQGQTPTGVKQFTMAELTNDKTKTGNVMANFLPVVEVTKDNVYDVVVKSGFQKYEDVYRNVPAGFNLPPTPAPAP
jgi:D-xylose transport system substrate-binding protein